MKLLLRGFIRLKGVLMVLQQNSPAVAEKTTRLCVDEEHGCFALLLFGTELRVYRPQADGELRHVRVPIADFGVTSVRDFAFLAGHSDPTVVLLYAKKHTWSGCVWRCAGCGDVSVYTCACARPCMCMYVCM